MNCPDQGICHHNCEFGDGSCWREKNTAPLTLHGDHWRARHRFPVRPGVILRPGDRLYRNNNGEATTYARDRYQYLGTFLRRMPGHPDHVIIEEPELDPVLGVRLGEIDCG